MTNPSDRPAPDGSTQEEPEPRLHDMGGDTGPTPSGSRGGGGLGPSAVRETEEREARDHPGADVSGTGPAEQESPGERARDYVRDLPAETALGNEDPAGGGPVRFQ